MDKCLFYSKGKCDIHGNRCPYNGNEIECDANQGMKEEPEDWGDEW